MHKTFYKISRKTFNKDQESSHLVSPNLSRKMKKRPSKMKEDKGPIQEIMSLLED